MFSSIVDDNIPPSVFGCPQDITVTGETSTIVTWTPPIATDNSGVIASSYSNYDSGDVFPLGSTEVVYGWVDASGNEATCSFTVTVAMGKYHRLLNYLI